MNPSENRKKRYKPTERVSLSSTTVSLLNKLLGQVQTSLPELRLTKSDLINWLLKSRSDKLSDKEIAAIERDYFDPVKALEAIVADAKKQQGLGEVIDIKALLGEKMLKKSRCVSKLTPTIR